MFLAISWSWVVQEAAVIELCQVSLLQPVVDRITVTFVYLNDVDVDVYEGGDLYKVCSISIWTTLKLIYLINKIIDANFVKLSPIIIERSKPGDTYCSRNLA
ncbi:hypothetical protein K7X08_032561 [Anisodus acutangulus]|uniref:Uncharacterized protein n=1 Tax=Anisodus acutangulus TaxID=402998 RepID=A0A9Q1MVQ5_9SOLA|nr:hypothetical protein K7X08_032561 [Anisodus acutangulus]